MLNLMSADETLAELRAGLKLHERLPQISTVHPVAIELGTDPDKVHDESTFVLCCHDDGNRRKHIVPYPSSQVNEQNPGESKRVHGHVARIIAAAYN